MENHPNTAPVLRRSERLKRKHDNTVAHFSVLSDERPGPSKRFRAEVSNASKTTLRGPSAKRHRPGASRAAPTSDTGTLPVARRLRQTPKAEKKQTRVKKLVEAPKGSINDIPTDTQNQLVVEQPLERAGSYEPTLDNIPETSRRLSPEDSSRGFGFDDVCKEAVMSVHSLPLELLSAIIEQLLDSGPALSASALTCSTWRAAARPFVYRKIIIRTIDAMNRLAEQLNSEPQIAYWIRTLRFEGKSVPRSKFPWSGAIWKTTDMDIDTWIYPFFSVIGTGLPNVRVLELFGFQHMSLRREDCERFAQWIVQLSRLESVESLHLSRCEMPPNALTAIIRSFPRLRNVAFTCVGCDVTARGGAELIGLSVNSSSSARTHDSKEYSSDGVLRYPVIHPPPRLHSLSVDNDLGDYSTFDFKLLKDWLRPAQLANSLRYLHGGGHMDWSSIALFLRELNTSPTLRTLRIFIEMNPGQLHPDKLDISSLINLRHLILDYPKAYLKPETMQCICLILGQVNTACLEEITLCIGAGDLDCMTEMDKSLRMDKFHDLKRFNLSVRPNPKVNHRDATVVAKSILPSMEAKGILHLIAPQKAHLP